MWVTLIMMVISFFMSGGAKKGNRTKALATSALVGAGTYYAVTQTNWGKSLDTLDNPATANTSATPVTDANGNPITTPIGQVVTSQGTSGWDVLKSWGPTGTALVAGTVGATAGTGVFKNIPTWVWLLGGGLLAYKFLKD